MRAIEFITESKTVEFEGLTLKISKNGHQLMVNALDDWGNKVLGHVRFNIGDGKELDPQDLKVDDKYQGQGIAKVMYDYVKSLGYTIARSYDQTDAGAGFWNKHRGHDVRVWEQGVAEGSEEKHDFIPVKLLKRNVPYWLTYDFYGHGGKLVKLSGPHPTNNNFIVVKDQDGNKYSVSKKAVLFASDPNQNKGREQGVAEGEDKSKDLIANAILDFYQHAGHISKEPVDNYVGTAKEMLGQVSDPKVKSKILDIFKQAKQSPYVQGGVVTTIGALLAGGVLSSAQKMGLTPAQTNLALQAILNTVIPTVVSRINGKSWSDTIKYTLASAGIGTGIAGMMEE